MMAKLTLEEINGVKSKGFLRNRGTDLFSGRVVPVGTVFTAEQFRALSELAEKFGNGKLIGTSRQAIEVPGIAYENIPAAIAFAEAHDLHFGGTGAKVRPITACKGTTCVYGNIDTRALAKTLYDQFYIGMRDVKLPHKFKIGVGGCPNSCMKPSLNDVGVEGCKSFTFDAALCRGCKKCAVTEGCPSKAVTVIDGKAVTDMAKCTRCGVCVGKCPFEAIPHEAKSVCRIYVGGTWGKTARMGTPLTRMVPAEQAADYVEKTMLWFKENAFAKERLGKAIDRIGIEAFEKAVFSDDLIARREEILAAPVKEG
jgi:dissimilatory sulfite reductase (desulfoviridin) alpha/beta subunit